MSPPDDLARLLETLVDRVARRVARAVVAELAEDEWIDQGRSPLGARRHMAAVRSAALPGRRIGRSYLARKADVERFLVTGCALEGVNDTRPEGRSKPKKSRPRDEVEELADRLGIALGGRR